MAPAYALLFWNEIRRPGLNFVRLTEEAEEQSFAMRVRRRDCRRGEGQRKRSRRSQTVRRWGRSRSRSMPERSSSAHSMQGQRKGLSRNTRSPVKSEGKCRLWEEPEKTEVVVTRDATVGGRKGTYVYRKEGSFSPLPGRSSCREGEGATQPEEQRMELWEQ